MSLGLEDLIRGGRSPQEAARLLTEIITTPDVLTMIFDLAATQDGREILAEWSDAWACYGLVAPWNELLAQGYTSAAQLGLPPGDAHDFSLAICRPRRAGDEAAFFDD